MSKADIESVLRNWIDEAITSSGKLGDGVDAAEWVAANFIAWWRQEVGDSLGSAELAAHRLRDELKQHSGRPEMYDALHELTHVQDSLGDLRNSLGLVGDDPADAG